MKKLLLLLMFVNFSAYTFSQNVSKKHHHHDELADSSLNTTAVQDTLGQPKTIDQDSLIKAKLVSLALNNPQIDVADANIKIAQYQSKKAGGEWLSTIAVGANANQFTIENSPAANFFPLYNVGANIPFDIFSKAKNDKKVADQNVKLAKALKEDKIRLIKSDVLTLYENFKEERELVRLEKILVEEENEGYISAQKDYSDGKIQLDDMNKTYQLYIGEQSKLVSIQRDFNVSKMELENMIGMPIDEALQSVGVKDTDEEGNGTN
jgi:outer membrane protein TolC